MLKYLVIILSPLLFMAGFWLFFYQEHGVIYLLGVEILNIIISGRILSRYHFLRFKLLWLNLIMVYISQLLFLLFMISGTARYWLAFLLSLLWGLIWWLLKNYFKNITDLANTDYLAINKFFYYLAFWFLSSSLYFLVIFLHFPRLYAAVALLLAALSWALDINRVKGQPNIYFVFFILFLLAQLVVLIYFLPLSFYVAGAIATLWFFFIIDNTVSQLKYFKLYLGLFLLSFMLLLITSMI